MPGDSGVTVVTCSCAFLLSHARLRVHGAPGIPCALFIREAEGSGSNPRKTSRGIAKLCLQTRYRRRRAWLGQNPYLPAADGETPAAGLPGALGAINLVTTCSLSNSSLSGYHIPL